jgi:signal transduction histidine kinase/ligand-binding sensor domain-containing protein
MWIGTQQGLNRYDGYNFLTYHEDLLDSTTLRGNWITDITEDRKGNLWIATRYGALNKYDYNKGIFSHYSVNDRSIRSDNNHVLTDLLIDSKEVLWVAMMTEGLFRYDSTHDYFYAYRMGNDKNSLSSNYVSRIAEDSKGIIWIATNDGILNRLDPGTNVITRLVYDPEYTGNPGAIISGRIYVDKQDMIWIGTEKAGLFCYDQITKSFTQYLHDANKNSLSNNTVTCVLEERSGLYWISTDHGGLNLFDLKKRLFTHFSSDRNNTNSLSNDQLYIIYKDHAKERWVGTYLGGINYFTIENPYFQFYTQAENNQGLSNKSVLTLYEGTEGKIWIGTDGGGLNIFDPRENTFQTFKNDPNNKNSLSSNIITSIYQDSKGRFWLGTYVGGLNMYNPKTKKFKTYYPVPEDLSSISSASIWSIFEDSKNNLWFGTLGGGLNLYNEGKDSFKRFLPGNNNDFTISSADVYSMYEDKDHTLWIATGYGLDLMDTKRFTFTTYNNIPSDSTSLSNNLVHYLYQDVKNNLWIGTDNGLNLFDYKRKKFKRFSSKNGLAGNIIQGILEDSKGNLWISTTEGLSKYNVTTGKVENYYVTDGLQSNEFAYKACIKAKDGRMYFGGVNGLNIFHPDSVKQSSIAPPLILTDFYIFNQSVKIGKGSPLQKAISETKEITLSYKQNIISFQYAAIDFIKQEKINYAYYLEGLEKEWNYVGKLRNATYTNLEPGEYVFRVKAIDASTIWKEVVTSINIIIKPPFWQTIWFRVLTILIILLLLYFAYKMRIHQLSNQKKRLEILVQEKTAELHKKNNLLEDQALELNKTNTLLEERQQIIEEQSEELMSQKVQLQRINEELHELNATKDKFFSIIAHDIKNPFNSILGFSELLVLNFNKWVDEEKLHVINVIFDSSKNLYELLENLLQWSRSQRGILEYKPEKVELKASVELIILLLKHSADAKEIEFILNLPEKGLLLHADPRLLDTILRNLISNAIKFTPKGGQIQIKAEAKDNFALVAVIDNGVGIPKAAIDNLFRIDIHHTSAGTDEEKGSGLGLILCKEFVEKHRGKIWIESEEGKGSKFFFTLPLEHIG